MDNENYFYFSDCDDDNVPEGPSSSSTKQKEKNKRGPKPNPSSNRQQKIVKKRNREQSMGDESEDERYDFDKGLITITDDWNRMDVIKQKREQCIIICQDLVVLGIIIKWIIQLEYWMECEMANKFLCEEHPHLHIGLVAKENKQKGWWVDTMKKYFGDLLTCVDTALGWLSLNQDQLECKLVEYCFKWDYKFQPKVHGYTLDDIKKLREEYKALPKKKKFSEKKSPEIMKIPTRVCDRKPAYFRLLQKILWKYDIIFIGENTFQRKSNIVDERGVKREGRIITFKTDKLIKFMAMHPHLNKYVCGAVYIFKEVINSEDFKLFWNKGYLLDFHIPFLDNYIPKTDAILLK